MFEELHDRAMTTAHRLIIQDGHEGARAIVRREIRDKYPNNIYWKYVGLYVFEGQELSDHRHEFYKDRPGYQGRRDEV